MMAFEQIPDLIKEFGIHCVRVSPMRGGGKLVEIQENDPEQAAAKFESYNWLKNTNIKIEGTTKKPAASVNYQGAFEWHCQATPESPTLAQQPALSGTNQNGMLELQRQFYEDKMSMQMELLTLKLESKTWLDKIPAEAWNVVPSLLMNNGALANMPAMQQTPQVAGATETEVEISDNEAEEVNKLVAEAIQKIGVKKVKDLLIKLLANPQLADIALSFK